MSVDSILFSTDQLKNKVPNTLSFTIDILNENEFLLNE